MKKTIPIIFALFFTNTYAADVIHVPTEPSLCTSDEVHVVSCEIESHKKNIISICANSNDGGKTYDNARYLFGKKNNIQLEYRVRKNDSKNKIYRGVDNGTYTTYFGFQNNAYFYVIGVPEERFGAKTFLNIYKNDSIVSSLQCKTNSFGMKDLQTNLFTMVDGKELSNGKVTLALTK